MLHGMHTRTNGIYHILIERMQASCDRMEGIMHKNAEYYMAKALELSKRAIGYTSPNPMVGCIVVKDGKIIGEGYHERYGELHAERNALNNCKEDPAGATLYVTLEPCCHYGKTPPCTEIIIEKRIKKVVIGAMDPNPKVGGNGVSILKEHGIEVKIGVLEKECLEVNEVFFHYITTKMPYVVMKYAMTLDGKIATCTGSSKWITSEAAREHAHGLRKQYKAILVGIETVIKDNPMLNCRIVDGVNPIRVICDHKLRIPMDSNIIKTAKEIPTMIAYSDSNEEKEELLRRKGIELIKIPINESMSKMSLAVLMEKLGERGIDSVLIEGGGNIHGSALEEKIVQKVYAYIATKLVGGKNALTPIAGNGIQEMKDAIQLVDTKIFPLGNDFVVVGKIKERRG